MPLTFLGTRANLDAASTRHARHSAALLETPEGRVMLDCGADWRTQVWTVAPDAIVLTHAHPDHAFGLQDGAPCPVYATPATWATIERYPIAARHRIAHRSPITVCRLRFEAFPVAHSTRCPAVGYRITADGCAPVFYVPDVVYIDQRDAALAGCGLFVGDGTTLTRSQVRKAGQHLVGHAPVRQQLTWCEKAGIPRALFTHCGREVVAGDADAAERRLQELAAERGLSARFATDGLSLDSA
jgi:phosphoribosyl 1,2-cyclic phosphodiesterase